MVHKSGVVSTFCSINYVVRVDSEQVRTTDAPLRVVHFSAICHQGADQLTDVLDDHFVRANCFLGKKSPAVDSASFEFDALFAEL